MDNTTDNLKNSTSEKAHKYPFHEFMVDFLGGLVPGTLFLVGAILALEPSLHLLYRLSSGVKTISILEPLSFVLDKAQHTPNMIWIGIFAFAVAISYVLGHLFYRRTPKKPDQKSFAKLSKSMLKQKPKDITNEQYLKTELACTNEDDCEFPYPYLREYLGQRGLCHLCPFVLWKDDGQGSSEITKLYRSKTYMNLLKIRLKYYYPEKCSSIIRNEAHVRLASSTWYVTHTLCICSYIGGTIIISSILFYLGVYYEKKGFIDFIKLVTGFVPFIMLPLLVFSTSQYIRERIEKFIHYQRLREVFYVLETAYTAFREEPQRLIPPFLKYSKDYSKEKCDLKCDCNDKNK